MSTYSTVITMVENYESRCRSNALDGLRMLWLCDLVDERFIMDRLCCLLNTVATCNYCTEKLCPPCVFDTECFSMFAETGIDGRKRHGLRIYDQ